MSILYHDKVLDISVGQRYGIVIRRPSKPADRYFIRASTQTHQVYQGLAILQYASSTTLANHRPRQTGEGYTNTHENSNTPTNTIPSPSATTGTAVISTVILHYKMVNA